MAIFKSSAEKAHWGWRLTAAGMGGCFASFGSPLLRLFNETPVQLLNSSEFITMMAFVLVSYAVYLTGHILVASSILDNRKTKD